MRLANLLPIGVAAAVLATVGVLYVMRGRVSLDPVASAATKTSAVGGYHFDLEADVTAAGRHLTMSGTGVADPGAKTADFRMRIRAGGATTSADTELLTDGDALYMKLPSSATMPQGKSWMKVDLSKVASAAGTARPALDPTQWLQALRAGAGVQRVGTDTVQGEQMTHYRGLVDLSQTARVPSSTRAEVQAEAKTLGLSTIPVDVWVDASGFVRRETLSMSGKLMTMTMTLDLTDVSSPVSVAPPPASQVLDVGALGLGAHP
jgi:hypothetical protein